MTMFNITQIVCTWNGKVCNFFFSTFPFFCFSVKRRIWYSFRVIYLMLMMTHILRIVQERENTKYLLSLTMLQLEFKRKYRKRKKKQFESVNYWENPSISFTVYPMWKKTTHLSLHLFLYVSLIIITKTTE